MSQVSIAKPEGAVAVSFKNEDQVGSQAVGPVYFIIEADGQRTYQPAIQREELDFLGNPQAEWLPRSNARGLAKHFGLPFEEV